MGAKVKAETERAATVRAIREHHALRMAAQRLRVAMNNAAKSVARRAVGFSTFQADGKRAKFLAAAQAVYDAAESHWRHEQWQAMQPGRAAGLVDKRRAKREPKVAPIPRGLDSAVAIVQGFGLGVWPTIEALERYEDEHADRACELTATLPCQQFIADTPGLGILGFASIVGEAGDIGSYRGPACLWKRMGVGLVDGAAQRRVKGEGGTKQGYSPMRRSMMYRVGDSLIKCSGMRTKIVGGKAKRVRVGAVNRYREIYLERKRYERKQHPKKVAINPDAKAKDRKYKYTDLHIHRRAQRYMEKRLLRDLWTAWRNEIAGTGPCCARKPTAKRPVSASKRKAS